jgi:hypothetical protein
MKWILWRKGNSSENSEIILRNIKTEDNHVLNDRQDITANQTVYLRTRRRWISDMAEDTETKFTEKLKNRNCLHYNWTNLQIFRTTAFYLRTR